MRKVIATLLAAAALAACGPDVNNGTITAKSFEEAYTSTYLMPISCGKNCTTFIPMTQHHPDRWYIEVEDCEHEGDAPGECHRAWLETSQASHDSWDVGDYVDFREEGE